MSQETVDVDQRPRRELLMGEGATLFQKIGAMLGHGILLGITSISAFSVLFIFIFIIKDAIPFFQMQGFKEFFTSIVWRTSADPPKFGALSIFWGSAMVTLGAIVVATPLGVIAALCLSDVLPFSVRQVFKPIIEMLAAIPSVAYGFFALVVFAPILQNKGGTILSVSAWIIGLPIGGLVAVVVGDMATGSIKQEKKRNVVRALITVVLSGVFVLLLYLLAQKLNSLEILSGRNALNVSIILGIMALPTVVSVSEDALSAVGRELREGSYALGSTRTEMLWKVVIPAATSGILAAVLLGVMRAVGETMVVWMAAGNASKLPEPFYNYLTPIRTLTATIAGDMAETPRFSAHYHSLFVMGACLLAFSFVCNLVSEWAVRHSKRKAGA
ncbi:MAG: PstC family ABC transporter permease [Candidatus Sumerlaeia bacterium]